MLAAFVFSGCGQPDPKPIIAAVEASQKAAFEKGDLDAYMSMWAPEATLTHGRFETPDPKTDIVLDRAAIQATKRLRLRKQPDMNMAFVEPVLTFDGDDNATLRTTTVVSGENTEEQVAEVYRLKKTQAGWKIVSNRFWLLSHRFKLDITRFDKAHYQKADAAVDEAVKSGDGETVANALAGAMRFKELHALATSRTKEAPKQVRAWITRARAALMAGDAPDALASARKARALNPAVRLPSWADEAFEAEAKEKNSP